MNEHLIFLNAHTAMTDNNAACLQRSYGICLYDTYKDKLIEGRLLQENNNLRSFFIPLI